MSNKKTISDSKRSFHESFPYVIPPIYRRVSDELLVELHLLSHQKNFSADVLFAIGLCKVFDEFTKGYRPDQHLKNLFDALCSSTGFDPGALRQMFLNGIESAKQTKFKELSTQEYNAVNNGNQNKYGLLQKPGHYTRLFAIGLITFISTTISEEELTEDEKMNAIIQISKVLELNTSRVEKDISIYQSNKQKLQQALELMKETVEEERKKRKLNNTNK